MRRVISMALPLVVLSTAAIAATTDDLQKGFDGALKGCEAWVLDPASWVQGTQPFLAATGLGASIAETGQVEPELLPPPSLRVGNRYWRINSTAKAGYSLIVSDRMAMCHITGGGEVDLQPAVRAVLDSPAFRERWDLSSTRRQGPMVSLSFRNRREPAFEMMVSYAAQAGGGRDHVQVLATALLNTGP